MEKKENYITLGKLLKLKEYANSGGEVKHIISKLNIIVNGEKENRRGKKLYINDEVIINGKKIKIELNENWKDKNNKL